MKKYIVLAIIAALASASYAATSSSGGKASTSLKEGTRELQLSGNYDPDAFDDYNSDLKIGYAQFLTDDLEVGVRGSYHGTDHVSIYGVQGLVEYNWDLGTEWVPFVGATVGWLGGEVDNPDNADSSNADTAAASALAGVKYFLTETVAIAGNVEFTKASDDIFPDSDGEVSDDNVEFNLSLRFFIP